MFEALIQQAAARHGLDPEMFRRQIQAESAGNPNAVSPKGAAGLGQLMPGTAAMMGVANPNDPQQNLNGSAGYMQKLLAQYQGNPRQALAAYNWGPGNLGRVGGDVSRAPPETQSYLQKILGTGAALPPPPSAAPATPPAVAAAGGQPGMLQPATQPLQPSQQNNQQRMLSQMAAGGMADRGTLASLLMGMPGATPGVARAQPQAPGTTPGFGLS